MQLSCDYHVTSDQFIMTNVMLPCGMFKKIKFITILKISTIYFLSSLIHTHGKNNFVPCGKIYEF
jgi:hypothetical protein